MNTPTTKPDPEINPIMNRGSILRKSLLVCGILSGILYIIATVLGAMQWPGYNPFDQSVSELIGIDAPSAPLVVPLFFIYSVLVYVFGAGVWMSAGPKKTLRIAAILMISKEIIGLVAMFLTPMHLRGVQADPRDTFHAIFTAVGVLLCMFPAIGFAAAGSGKSFRFYSIITMLIFLVFGALAGALGPQVAANLPTPWLGVYERINIFSYFLWVTVLAIALFKVQPDYKNPIQ